MQAPPELSAAVVAQKRMTGDLDGFPNRDLAHGSEVILALHIECLCPQDRLVMGVRWLESLGLQYIEVLDRLAY
jgi:hypothetical protein